MAASRASSRRATWSFWTRSVVRVNRTRAAVLDQGEADGGGEMALAAAGWAEQEQVGAFGQPAVAGGDGHDLGLGDHRHGLEVEGVEGLSGQQAGFGEMALDAAPVAFGEFVLGDGGEEAGGGPSFLVGLFGELRPHQLDGGQAQLVEQEAEARGYRWPGSSSCRLSRLAGAEQLLVGIERDEVDDDVAAARAGSGAKRAPQGGDVGQLPGLQIGGEQIGEFGLAAALMGQGEQVDHDAAGLLLRQPLQEGVEGSAIGFAREQLVAIDEVEQRHRLAAQRVDHMPIVDDLVVLAAGMARPRGSVIRCVPPMNRSSRSSYRRTRSRWPIRREGTV